MQSNAYDALLLQNQLCFPLYACAREVIKAYTPLLDEIGLTYTQYVTMMVMWEEHSTSSRRLGQRLHLDSGTLTPVLKKLEEKGLITRRRSKDDERNLSLSLTEAGEALRAKAADIPADPGEGADLVEQTQVAALPVVLPALHTGKIHETKEADTVIDRDQDHISLPVHELMAIVQGVSRPAPAVGSAVDKNHDRFSGRKTVLCIRGRSF